VPVVPAREIWRADFGADVNTLVVEDFANLFGTPSASLPPPCLELIKKGDWNYTPLEGEQLDNLLREFLDRIKRRDFSIVAADDKSRWIKGWSENLDDFIAAKGNPEALAPKYIRPNSPVRLFRRFVLPREPRFELNWYRVLQQWLFPTYFADCDTIFEFGSGSGINVALLAQMFPKKKIVGLDWTEPACEIVNSMRRLRGWNVEGRQFDFFNPDWSLELPADSIVLTVGALEQTLTRHGAFIDFLVAKKPKLCVFVEPIYEWYVPANLADHCAIRAHEVRNFWKGFPDRLQQLVSEGRAEIVKQKRSEFGSLVLEGYSQNIWRVL
jgi:hypothetical protein